jgi:hypothetical protein
VVPASQGGKLVIFLIAYDRIKERLTHLESFSPLDTLAMRARRLVIEVECLQSSGDHDIVAIEAPDEKTLRETHSAYFKSTTEMLNQAPLPYADGGLAQSPKSYPASNDP